jgi:voltage-gated potassium channel Kch
MAAHAGDQDLTSWDIFILGLSVLSIVNIALVLAPSTDAINSVVLFVDAVLCPIFLVDFALHLKRAPNKRTYLINQRGWLDFLGSLPFPGLRLARLFRMARVASVLHRDGPRKVWQTIAENRAGSALLGTIFLTIVLLEFGSVMMLAVEKNAPDANILSASDALWWSYVTVTTVGYGDRFPVTNPGRLVGVAMLTIGVGLFGVLTGFLANTFLAPAKDEEEHVGSSVDELRQEIAELKRLIQELGERSTAADR